MALAVDASSPALFSGTTRAISSASFTTPTNVFLLAMVGRNGALTGDDDTGTISGAGVTWTLAGRKSAVGATGQISGGTAQPSCTELWWASSATALTAQTITDTATQPGNAGVGYDHAVQLLVFTGAETTWGGAISAGGAASGLPSMSLTTTRAAAWVFASATDWAANGNATAGASQTIQSQYTNTGQISIHFWRQTATTSSSGTSVTDNVTAPSAEQWNGLIIEIRPPAAAGVLLPDLIMAPRIAA